MGNLPESLTKLIEEMMAKAPSQGQQSTESNPTVDLELEWQEFCHSFAIVEPQFDFQKADRNILTSLFAWIWHYDRYNILKLDYNKGLYLYGSLGRGKSLTLRAMQNYMNRLDYRHDWKTKKDYRMSISWKSASELATIYADGGQSALTRFYDWECNLCIDELGREPNPANNFGTKLDVVQFLLQMRYDHRRTSVTHITTNLLLDEMNNIYGDYVADRCLEMFNFIEFKGKSFRH